LDAFLTLGIDKSRKVLKVPELWFIDSRLGADRKRCTHLGDNHADLTRRNLHHWMSLNGIKRPELEPETGHEQGYLVASLASKSDNIPATEFSP
jgi:hypothetical protein